MPVEQPLPPEPAPPPADLPPDAADPLAAPVRPSPLVGRDGRPAAVVHLAAELAPYARTGGLGEAVASLAGFQAAHGVPTSVIMPLYREARARVERLGARLEPVGDAFAVPVGARTEAARLWRLHDPPPADGERRRRPRPAHYFVQNDYYFNRGGIYGEGADYGDNARRYALFCAAALGALPRVAAGPLLLHAHDWHTALAPAYLRTAFAGRPYYDGARAVLSVHNAGFQGHFAAGAVPDVGLPWSAYTHHAFEWYGRLNLLKGGLAYADAAVTVSPTHADELRTAAGGFGLHDHFRSLGTRFGGVVNGIDQAVWNPGATRTSPPTSARTTSAGKRACRAPCRRATGSGARRRAAVRHDGALVWQKGLDLVLADTGLFELDAQWCSSAPASRATRTRCAACRRATRTRCASTPRSPTPRSTP
jgi:starch synthase